MTTPIIIGMLFVLLIEAGALLFVIKGAKAKDMESVWWGVGVGIFGIIALLVLYLA